MLTPYPRAWGLPTRADLLTLADLPHWLAAVAAGHGPTPGPLPSPSLAPAGGVVRRWLTDPAGSERRLLAGVEAAVSG